MGAHQDTTAEYLSDPPIARLARAAPSDTSPQARARRRDGDSWVSLPAPEHVSLVSLAGPFYGQRLPRQILGIPFRHLTVNPVLYRRKHFAPELLSGFLRILTLADRI